VRSSEVTAGLGEIEEGTGSALDGSDEAPEWGVVGPLLSGEVVGLSRRLSNDRELLPEGDNDGTVDEGEDEG
jgi:hypothetical protein